MNRCGLALDQDDGLDSRDAHGARYLPYHEFRRGRRTIRALGHRGGDRGASFRQAGGSAPDGSVSRFV